MLIHFLLREQKVDTTVHMLCAIYTVLLPYDVFHLLYFLREKSTNIRPNKLSIKIIF